MFRHILVPYDGSNGARRALEVALEIARVQGSQVSLLSVEERLPHFPGDVGEVKDEQQRQQEYFARLQRTARELAKLQGMDFASATIRVGHVAQSILDHAKAQGCDLIVMGHSGQSGVWANLLGTTAQKVSGHAHCSVLIVR